MEPNVGVVCTRGKRLGRPAAFDAYLLAQGRKAAWFDGEDEDISFHDKARGTLCAVVGGEGDDLEHATIAATSVARVLVKLWTAPATRDPQTALVAFLKKAHERMYWKAREREGELAASVAVAWWLDDGGLAWAEIGAARLYVQRNGALHRLGKAWSEGSSQRMIAGSVGLGDDAAIHLSAGVNHGTVKLHPGDRILAATAGLWEGVDEPSLKQLLTHVDDPQTAAVSAMERAVARGSVSPVTAIVVDLAAPERVQEAPSRAERAVTTAIPVPEELPPSTEEVVRAALAPGPDGPLHLTPPPRRGRRKKK